MRFLPLLLMLLLAGGCASTPEQRVAVVHRHQTAPESCRGLDSVEVRAAQQWWHGLAGPASYERQALDRLLHRARKAGGNGVRITHYRAFTGPEKGDGIVRVEIAGEVLECPSGPPRT